MENALLGDSMIEKLRAEGTAAEKEKQDAMGKLRQLSCMVMVNAVPIHM
jgi:hypothetical protein